MVFPVVMYECESWTIKKSESQKIDAFENWCWRRLLSVPRIARRCNRSILKEISPECSLEGPMLKLKLQFFGHLMWRTDSFEKPWCRERLKAEGEGDDRGWLDGITDSMDMKERKWKMMKSLHRVRLFVTPWTVAYQAPPSIGFFQASILEWVVISFSRKEPRASQPRSWTRVSHIIGKCFTVWATREIHWLLLLLVSCFSKLLTGFLPQAVWGHRGTTELGSSLASCRACHSFTQAHCRVNKVQQKMCSLGEQRTRAPSILTLFWRIVDEPPRWKVVAEPRKMPGFMASGGEEFNLGPEMRLDCSELLCNKVLLTYKGERESFWHRRQKGAERVPPC